jgi:hypothetical protein
MEFREKVLYHQIHPLTLLTDWGAGLVAIVTAWARGMRWPSSSLNSRGRSDAQ